MVKNLILFFLGTLSVLNISAQKNYTKYVDPFIGTGGHGHTYPGATLPHGMVQLSPDTRLEGWDGCGGYHYSDSFIYGFTHTHLSGTGVSDYGDILLMPMNGEPSANNKIYGSLFSHNHENATAGYYRVKLDDDNIDVELTASERVGFHHYRFSSVNNTNVILDLKHRDEVIESSLKLEDSVTLTGLRRSKAWAENQYVFFVIKFSRPVKHFGIWDNDKPDISHSNSVANSTNLKAYFQFDLAASKDIFIKVALSPVSIDGAKKNLIAEIPGWDFDAVKQNAEKKWNAELSKIEVSGKDENKLKIFYTALYHTAIVPNINMDVDGQYRGRDDKIHSAQGFTYYSVFSLWDTYRAAHPLYTIIDRSRTLDYIKTFLVQFREGGRLPVWELASCETDCMIGYHSIPVIVDAYEKGITSFDTKLALEAMKHSADRNVFGLPAFNGKGVIEVDDESENVSKTLEYAYDDWCIAKFAGHIGNGHDYTQYMKRAQYYKNILDLKTGFMQPRKNGDWLHPFDPREVNNNFTEANSWQYSFYVPQDITGYIKMIGGNKSLEHKLDSLFSASTKTTGRDQSDITGLIGQYAHGNEPSHHIIYLYNYTASPFKTQRLVHKVLTEMYQATPEGLIGNEDCGQMSAWYVLSALGFYPVTPGSNYYMIGSPVFEHAEIHLENGKNFIIDADGVSDKNFYIGNAKLSSSSMPIRKWDIDFIEHKDIAGGGHLIFSMQSSPSSFFLNKYARVEIKDSGTGKLLVMNPVINGGPVPFKNSKEISISSSQKNVAVFFTIDGKEPGSTSEKYIHPFIIKNSCTVKAIAIDSHGDTSFTTTAEYKKLSHDWTVTLNSKYEQQYDAGGADGLIDEIRGTADWRKGNWQGYQKNDLNVVIDMHNVKNISKVTLGLLQDTRAWIVMPKKINIELSLDGKNYIEAFAGENFLPIEDLIPEIHDIPALFPTTAARYVRITAQQFGKLPAWHEGAGGDTHIFIDEIGIE